jgi:hypothetical protein
VNLLDFNEKSNFAFYVGCLSSLLVVQDLVMIFLHHNFDCQFLVRELRP